MLASPPGPASNAAPPEPLRLTAPPPRAARPPSLTSAAAPPYHPASLFEAVLLGPQWATMNKILDFGRRALFVIRVMSGYEERKIRAHRLELQKRIEQVQARKESLRKIPEQAILSEVRCMVEEMQTVLRRFEETEAAIDEYFKPFDKNAEIIVNMQLEKEEKSAKEMLKAMRDQAILQKFEQERMTILGNAAVSQEPVVNPTSEEMASTTREEVDNLTSLKPKLSGTPQGQSK